MKRIKVDKMLDSYDKAYSNLSDAEVCSAVESIMLAYGINEIMDYLEHMHGRNGKLFTCVNCHKATGYIGDLGKCCDKPLYEVSD